MSRTRNLIRKTTRKIVCFSVLVLALPLTALAEGGIASSVVNLIATLPEPGTLGILGSGLIGFAVVVRRKLKLLARPVQAGSCVSDLVEKSLCP